jgi:hypothetical protein
MLEQVFGPLMVAHAGELSLCALLLMITTFHLHGQRHFLDCRFIKY